MTPSPVLKASGSAYRVAKRLVVATSALKVASHPKGALLQQGFQKRVDLEQSWEDKLNTLSAKLLDAADIDAAYEYAKANWKETKKRRVRKESGDEFVSPDAAEVSQRLMTAAAASAWEHGAVKVYLGLALDTGDEAGQYALQMLGLNQTFAWAHPRNMAQDLFAVRGSKVVQNMYGAHLDTLTQIITNATDPRNPLPINAVKAQIKEQWPDLAGYQVQRIARTETAAVWTTTQANAYAANGISKFESIIATRDESQGSTLIETEDPCDECVEMAAMGPMDLSGDLPPWHPNCRCEAIPVLEEDDGTPWLPPAEPWAGEADADLSATPDLEG